ncbi:hypothetical protein ACFE04_019104 [Oxalis oulophora]
MEATEKNLAKDVVLQIESNNGVGYRDRVSVGGSIALQQLGSSPIQSPSGEIAPSPGKPPKFPSSASLTRRKSLARSALSKSKSRLVETSYLSDADLKQEKTSIPNTPTRNSPNYASPNNKTNVSTPRGGDHLKSVPVTPRTPLIEPLPGEDDDDDDEEVYKTANMEITRKFRKKWKTLALIEWTLFVCIMGVLISCLTVDKLRSTYIWGLRLWRWFVLVLVIFSGRLATEWLMNIIIFVMERNFVLKKKVLYFVYGMKKSVQVFLWLSLVLLTWLLLFHGDDGSKEKTRILNYITKALAATLVAAAIWLLKNVLVKTLAVNFQCTRFFDRIQESLFAQYILQTLSGPPLIQMAENVGRSGQLSISNLKKDKNVNEKESVIDIEKLNKMKQEKVSAWTMKGLVNVISNSSLFTISNTLDSISDDENEQKNSDITSEWEAKAAAYRVFHNVARPGHKYVDEGDLLRFFKKQELDQVLPLFDGAVETGKIKRSSFKKWLVKVYLERKSLAHSLNDTKTAIEELNKLVSALVLLVSIIVWLLVMGFLTYKVLLVISSQLLVVVFMFGNTAKTVFEAIIFVFVMHPFDVGDRCVIDGVQMIVEEMNILTTIFLRYDNEKIIYPNSVLATKPISNFYRSPEMSDSVEFSVDFSTSVEKIAAIKARIKIYLESKPQHWRPNHGVVVKEIKNVNKLKMALYVNHTINFQVYGDKTSRRSDLVLELKRIFEDLEIKYHLPSQDVQVSYAGSSGVSSGHSFR